MSVYVSEFQGLDESQPIRVYHRDLPHWRQDGATYFVTFRLADSIPEWKLRQWRNERETWYFAHGLSDDLSSQEWQRRYKDISPANCREFERRIAHQILSELDKNHGSCLLQNRATADVVSEALIFFDETRCRCGDFCIMPNHVHWLVLPLPGHELEQVLASIKSYTAKQMNKLQNSSGSVWQRESYDRLVRDAAELWRTRRYMKNNPGKSSNSFCGECEWLNSVEALILP